MEQEDSDRLHPPAGGWAPAAHAITDRNCSGLQGNTAIGGQGRVTVRAICPPGSLRNRLPECRSKHAPAQDAERDKPHSMAIDPVLRSTDESHPGACSAACGGSRLTGLLFLQALSLSATRSRNSSSGWTAPGRNARPREYGCGHCSSIRPLGLIGGRVDHVLPGATHGFPAAFPFPEGKANHAGQPHH